MDWSGTVIHTRQTFRFQIPLVVTMGALSLVGCRSKSDRSTPPPDIRAEEVKSPGEDVDDILGEPKVFPPGERCGGVQHTACEKGWVCRLDPDEGSDPLGTCVEDARVDNRRLSGIGGKCGGVAGFECAPGLVCKVVDVDQSDPMGVCVKR
jgi:hypothetical protein